MLKLLNVIDEQSSLCLAIRVGRRCKAKDVVAVLEELTSLYPAPAYIRFDNVPGVNYVGGSRQLRRRVAPPSLRWEPFTGQICPLPWQGGGDIEN